MKKERPAPLWRRVFDVVLNAGRTSAVDEAPMIWLLGKVQSGKTSIVRAVTGDAEAEIGRGFRPCTCHWRVYDFPPDLPVVRFLDSRGLGEVDYDPAEDLAMPEGRAHAVVAVVRAMDPAQQELLAVLRQVRRRHPDRAVLLVQTRLHDGYPDERDHLPPEQLRREPELDGLRRALEVQERAFRDLPGSGAFDAVAVDLTHPEDGFSEPDHGLDALVEALDRTGSPGHASLLRELAHAGRDARLARIHPRLVAHATAAGATDLVPVMGFFP